MHRVLIRISRWSFTSMSSILTVEATVEDRPAHGRHHDASMKAANASSGGKLGQSFEGYTVQRLERWRDIIGDCSVDGRKDLEAGMGLMVGSWVCIADAERAD